MKSNSLVTIYVPSRNYGKFLDKALESISNQVYKNWELFIIDEASEDNTLIIAEYFKQKTLQEVYIIRNDKPIGLQKIANHILRKSKGKYIIRLDADDWLDEMALLIMITKFESDLNIGLVYGNYFYTDIRGKVLGFERRLKIGQEDDSMNIPPHGACTMIKTNLLKSLSGYSEEINSQDGWDLWFKLTKISKPANVEAPIFFYRQHENSLSRDSQRLLNSRSKIFEFQNNNLKKGGYKNKCLAIIPVKQSYDNIANIPFLKVQGKSLLELSIKSALDSNLISDVLISTNSDEVLDFSKKLENENKIDEIIKIKRPDNISINSINPIEIIVHALGEYYKIKSYYPDTVVFLSIHCPNRNSLHVNKAINAFHVQGCDSLVSVVEERAPIFKHGKYGLKLENPGRFQGLNFEREIFYKFNGAIIISWVNQILNNSLFGEKIGFIEMSENDSKNFDQLI